MPHESVSAQPQPQSLTAATTSVEVAVWSCSAPAKSPHPSQVHCFSAEERDKAGKIQDSDARALFINGRLLLRHCLAPRLGCAPSDLRFTIARHGKPALCAVAHPGAMVAFNVAHCCDRIVIAIAAEGRIGIDVERCDRLLAWRSLSRRFFADSEYQALLRLPEPLQRTAFIRTWVRKEALMKALGSGIAGGLRRFQLHISTTAPPQLKAVGADDDQSQWSLADIDSSPEHFVAIATDRALGAISIQPTPELPRV